MDKDTVSMLLTQARPSEAVTVSAETLHSLFRHGGRDPRLAANRFAEEHNCSFDLEPTGDGRFTKGELRNASAASPAFFATEKSRPTARGVASPISPEQVYAWSPLASAP